LEEGNDYVLTKQQIIDIVVELKVPELNDRLKIEKHIFKTKFGYNFELERRPRIKSWFFFIKYFAE
jgi:hypothetical protein